MSEPIPESIPTSSDRRSNRPTKKRALTPLSQQSQQVEALFAHPDRDIVIGNAAKLKTLAAPPEIVTNVQGSSAGAGSGEFHVYKASRRREYERLRVMDEETKKEDADRKFEEQRAARLREDEEKLSRNRAKREKAKARQAKKKKAGGKSERNEMDVDGKENGAGVVKKKLGPKLVPASSADEVVEKNGENNEGGVPVEDPGITFHDED